MAGSSWRDSTETRVASIKRRVDASIALARQDMARDDSMGEAAAGALPQDVVDTFLRDGLVAGIRRLRELRPDLTPTQVRALMQPDPAPRSAQSVSVAMDDAAPRPRTLPQPPRIPTIQPGDSGRHGWLLWPLAACVAVLAWAWLGHA